jgi:hypothetical protein
MSNTPTPQPEAAVALTGVSTAIMVHGETFSRFDSLLVVRLSSWKTELTSEQFKTVLEEAAIHLINHKEAQDEQANSILRQFYNF